MTEHDHSEATDDSDEEPTTEVTDETIAESIGDPGARGGDATAIDADVTETAFDEGESAETNGSSGESFAAIDRSRDADRSSAADEPPSNRSTTSTRSAPASDRASTVRRYLAWGSLFVLSLFAVFAMIQFYASATDAIDLWIEPKYQPIMRAAFNLAVLLAAGAGVSLSLRELA